MRFLATAIIAAAIVYFVLRSTAPESVSPSAMSAPKSPASSPAAPAADTVSWPKRSLDRAAEVKRQIATARKADENP